MRFVFFPNTTRPDMRINTTNSQKVQTADSETDDINCFCAYSMNILLNFYSPVYHRGNLWHHFKNVQLSYRIQLISHHQNLICCATK